MNSEGNSREVGAMLVDRCARGVASSDEALLLRDYVRALEVGIDQAEERGEQMRDALLNILDVAMGSSAAKRLPFEEQMALVEKYGTEAIKRD